MATVKEVIREIIRRVTAIRLNLVAKNKMSPQGRSAVARYF